MPLFQIDTSRIIIETTKYSQFLFATLFAAYQVAQRQQWRLRNHYSQLAAYFANRVRFRARRSSYRLQLGLARKTTAPKH